ncbi:MAG: fused MFS/spermidine synthase [Candidatus Latescibacter sp.]|nr:fused MFS/spermidine synthase [Candidatus Latescibacter sp.]
MSKKTKAKDKQISEQVIHDTAGIIWVMLIFFCSGVCSLIDEVVWVRLLKLTLGNTEYASSIVVSVFMGGLALGALIMGKYADRVKRRLMLYATLELCATVSALLLPFFLRFADGAYRFYFVKFQPSPSALMVVQVLVSAVMLLVPSMIMGSTLPLLSRYVTSLEDRVGRFVGRLYAVNTLGATVGCFLAGFVLIRMAGVMGALYIAAGINLFVACGGWVLSRFYEVAGEKAVYPGISEKRSVSAKHMHGGKQYMLMLAFFTSGLISIGYELIWMRSIVIPLGGFTYVFSAVLTVYLSGNVIGAWIGSHLSRRLNNPAAGFGISLTCLGALGILYIPWFSTWLYFLHYEIPRFGGLSGITGFEGMILPLFSSIILFLLPSIAMGIGFPLALQGWSNYYHGVGLTTGTVYGVNTIGAVLGGLATGFILIPRMGAQLSITVLGIVGIWLGMTVALLFMRRISVTGRIVSASVAVGLTGIAFIIPSDLFVQKVVSTPDIKTIAVNEGVTTTVAVLRNSDGNLLMTSNGVLIAGDDVHRTAQKMLGHLGVLLNKDSRNVLSVGFGSGETTFCLAQHDLSAIDCVEIAPEVVQVALEYFTHINLGDRLNQKVNMKYMDAKNYLHVTDRHYDVIINDADVPTHSGSAPMFAKEHFQNALDHVNPGGLVISKLHLAGISGSSFDSILGTFLGVFPHVTIWFPTTKQISFFYLVGSRQKQLFSPKYIEENIRKESVQNSVAYLNFHNSVDVLSCYFGDETDIRRYLKDFHINSDYTPYVEFNIAQQKFGMLDEIFPQFIEKVRRNSLSGHIDLSGLSKDEQEKWLKDYELTYNTSTYLLLLFREKDTITRMQYILDGLKLMPEHPILLEQQKEILSYIKGTLAQGRSIEGIDLLLQNRSESGIAWLLKSWVLIRENKIEEALKAAEKSVAYSPSDALAQDNLGWILATLNQTDKAIVHFSEAVQLSPNEPVLHFNLGNAYARLGQFDKAVFQIQRLVEIQPRNFDAHVYLGDLLFQQGKRNEAINEYRTALKIDPNNARARSKLNAVAEK